MVSHGKVVVGPGAGDTKHQGFGVVVGPGAGDTKHQGFGVVVGPGAGDTRTRGWMLSSAPGPVTQTHVGPGCRPPPPGGR